MGNKQESPKYETGDNISSSSYKYKTNHKTKRTNLKNNSKPINKSVTSTNKINIINSKKHKCNTNPSSIVSNLTSKPTPNKQDSLNNNAKKTMPTTSNLKTSITNNTNKNSNVHNINILPSSGSTTPCSPLSKSRKHRHAIYPHSRWNNHGSSPRTPITINGRRGTVNGTSNGMITPSPSASPLSPNAFHHNTHNIIYTNMCNHLPIPSPNNAHSPYSPVAKKSLSSLHFPIITTSSPMQNNINNNNKKHHHLSPSKSWSSMSNPYSKTQASSVSKSAGNSTTNNININSATSSSTTPWMLYTDIKLLKRSDDENEINNTNLTCSQLRYNEIMVSEPSPSPSESMCSYDYRQSMQQYNHQQRKLAISDASNTQNITKKVSIAQSSTVSIYNDTDVAIVDID